MNSDYSRTFKDPTVLQEMLILRGRGWSITALADKYGCNFSSVWHQCKKHQIVPVKITVRFIPIHTDFDGTPLNRGKSYKDYLREENERRRQTLYRRIQKDQASCEV